MKAEDFTSSAAGRCQSTAQGFHAFYPGPLPELVTLDDETGRLLADASRALGELSGTGRILPDPYVLIGPYTRREAVASSKIEGTLTTLDDLFLYEAARPRNPRVGDVVEVSNYVAAMDHGMSRIEDGRITLDVVRAIHGILMKDSRDAGRDPGRFRDCQVYIGSPGMGIANAAFVPPPPDYLDYALGLWEKYVNSPTEEDPLVQCALMHYLFESVHPFSDGNGRVGRLLITFFLCSRGCLSRPLLYISDFIERHKMEYYDCLLAVSQKGDYTRWIRYFLTAVERQSRAATGASGRIISLQTKYRDLLAAAKNVPDNAHRILENLFRTPFVSVSRLGREWDTPFKPLQNAVDKLVEVGILTEITDRKRNKLYLAKDLHDLVLSL